MGRQKRDVPTGKMRLKYPKTGYDTSKEYTLYYEYNWNREIIRRDSGFRVKVTDWNVSSKIDFHQSGTEKGTRERVRSKVTKFGYHYNFLSSF